MASQRRDAIAGNPVFLQTQDTEARTNYSHQTLLAGNYTPLSSSPCAASAFNSMATCVFDKSLACVKNGGQMACIVDRGHP
jgi:hypothetical protein